MSLIFSSFISPASPSKSSGRSQPFRSSSSTSFEIVIVLAPLKKHGTDHRYTEDRTLSERVVHDVRTLIGQRVFAIALGYEDLVDHDDLRHDPVLGPVLGRLEARRPDCAPLAGKSTLNRLEQAPVCNDRYRKIAHDPKAIENVFVDLFLDAHTRPPARITLDLDATDDPIHGRQEGRFFHGYYDCYCYLPLYVFCGEHLLAAKLRRANIDASAGAADEIARIVRHIRERWPRVRILLRGDSGFAREGLMAWCEANRVDYLFGLARNSRLVDRIYVDLAWAGEEAERTGRPARRFADFRWTTRDSWSRRRRVVAKAEWMPGRGENGANPRFVVTSLASGDLDARTLYERVYCARGDMENRATWKTGSKNASSTCLPTAPVRRPWPRTSCGCGSPPWPMCCCVRYGERAWRIPGWRRPPAARCV